MRKEQVVLRDLPYTFYKLIAHYEEYYIQLYKNHFIAFTWRYYFILDV